ncbi:serine/threonine-protein kinase [Brevundimonas sp. M1A4_2e]
MFNVVTRATVSFEIKKEIGGEGKNSQAFLAYDAQLGADIVIKRVAKADLRDPQAYYNESRALYASAHPNVVQVHYACEDGDNVFIAMPYYRKGSVRGLMAARYLTSREVVAIGCQVFTGLHNLHSKALVHFDIKPDNILLSDRGEALITDFGLCQPLTNGLATPEGIYAPNWPPEALQKTGFDARYDIFQTGLALYAMCVGLKEYKAQFEAYAAEGVKGQERFFKDVAAGTHPNRKAFPPHIPSRLKAAITKCLEVDPDNRFQSALEAMNALASVDGEELDWRYEERNGERVWKKDCEGTKYVFSICSAGNSSLTKSVNGAAARKITGGSIQGIGVRDIAKVLRTYG